MTNAVVAAAAVDALVSGAEVAGVVDTATATVTTVSLKVTQQRMKVAGGRHNPGRINQAVAVAATTTVDTVDTVVTVAGAQVVVRARRVLATVAAAKGVDTVARTVTARTVGLGSVTVVVAGAAADVVAAAGTVSHTHVPVRALARALARAPAPARAPALVRTRAPARAPVHRTIRTQKRKATLILAMRRMQSSGKVN